MTDTLKGLALVLSITILPLGMEAGWTYLEQRYGAPATKEQNNTLPPTYERGRGYGYISAANR